jgi:nucleoside-diphosphate-sugar epimerase
VRLGNLDPIRDLTFVKDTALGFIAGAKSDKCVGNTYNLGVGQGVSIRELVERIGELIGKNLKVESDPQRIRPAKSEVTRLISNNSKMKELSKWQPTVNLDDGLQQTINYIQENLNEFKIGRYNV